MMNRINVYAALLLLSGFCADNSSALTVPYFDDFNSIVSTQLNTAPAGWNSIAGTVDSIKSGDFGITCFGGSGGCVDLDGSTNQAGYLLTSGTFNLVGGQTYQLSAYISGNQRGAHANDVNFGFFNTSNLVLASTTVNAISSSSPFTLYSVLFTPSTNVVAKLFFNDVLGNNSIGPILDDVSVTAVPLPAAAWLLLSGLVGIGALARRRRSERPVERLQYM
jgi:hypothetical protein